METPTNAEKRPARIPAGMAMAALEAAATACFVTDSDGVIVWVNPAFTALTGFTEAEALGETPRILKSGAQDAAYYAQLWATIRSGQPFSSTVVNKTKAGPLCFVAQTVTPLPRGSSSPTHFIAFQEDISAQREYERQLEHLAYTDALTGLANRRALMDQLTHAGKAMPNAALLLLDMDNFKRINDRFGHEAGDIALREVADALRRAAPGARLYRLGGDEFVALVEAPGIAALDIAIEVANAIRAEVGRISDARRGRDLSISVGVAGPSSGASDGSALLHCADLALAEAKSARSGICVYEQSMGEARRRETRLRQDLPIAVEARRIRVAYQPIVEVRSRRSVGIEALARWRHPRFGEVGPDEFIRIAEQTNLIGPLGDFVLTEALHQQGPRCRALGLRLAVNVSPLQLGDELFPRRLSNLLEEVGFPPYLLDLEVTETGDMRRWVTDETVQRISGMGISFVIDDFGAGASRISYLADFPISGVKLDRSLVQGAVGSQRRVEYLRGIVTAAHIIGARVIGEGIETHAQLEVLKSVGCDLGQGFLFGRPAEVSPERRMAV